MNNLVDVHCHLESENLLERLDQVILDAKKEGVRWIITSGTEPKSNRKSIELCKKYPEIIKCSLGLFPVDAAAEKLNLESDVEENREIEKFEVDAELLWIEQNIDNCVALGECGYDFNMLTKEESLEIQKANFQKMINLSKKYEKPLLVHTRKGELEAIELLEENNCKNVIIHCFTGKKSLIKRCVENGWFFSIPAKINRLEQFRLIAEIVPIEQILTETDAPLMRPYPEKINEPKNIAVTIKELSKILHLTEEDVADQIYKNTSKLFGF